MSTPDIQEEMQVPQIKDGYRKIKEKEITQLEIDKVTDKFKKDKTPGTDGFTGEFYKRLAET